MKRELEAVSDSTTPAVSIILLKEEASSFHLQVIKEQFLMAMLRTRRC
jgi:hypothetical protein